MPPPVAGIADLAAGGELEGDGLKACCATAYADPAVRWLLGEELHPGGEGTTRRALELAGLQPGQRLLDVASGSGASAMLAARELGAEAVGVEYGAEAVRAARELAAASGLGDRVGFVRGDAEALPFADGSFDVVLCECSLCTFPDKRRAAAELRRVLRPGRQAGALRRRRRGARCRRSWAARWRRSPASAGPSRSPATKSCSAGRASRVSARELCREDADLFTRGIEERLRGARLLGIAPPAGAPIGVEEAIAATRLAREAIAAGTLGYAIVIGEA